MCSYLMVSEGEGWLIRFPEQARIRLMEEATDKGTFSVA